MDPGWAADHGGQLGLRELTNQIVTLGMTSTQVGLIATVYLVGEMIGALVFGKMSDRMGRKRLFIFTLLLYLIGAGLAAITGHHTGQAGVLLPHPAGGRDGYRRAVLGDR